jgi:hypothetical protein
VILHDKLVRRKVFLPQSHVEPNELSDQDHADAVEDDEEDQDRVGGLVADPIIGSICRATALEAVDHQSELHKEVREFHREEGDHRPIKWLIVRLSDARVHPCPEVSKQTACEKNGVVGKGC